MFGIGNLATQLKLANGTTMNMLLFDKIKTGDPIIDGLLMTVLVTFMTYLIQYINNIVTDNFDFNKIISYDYLSLIKKRNGLTFEGKISTITNAWNGELQQVSTFTDRFRALWNHIINNVGKNDTIYHIKEYSLLGSFGDNKEKDTGIYMVNQNRRFLVSKEYQIYAIASYTQGSASEEGTNKPNSQKPHVDIIKIELFSYVSSIDTIKAFVDNLTTEYMSKIKNLRENKKFIYTLTSATYKEEKYEMWSETEFSSTRTFNNLFFEKKTYLLDKLDFFLNNREWYFEKGIPYSLGIGMYGPPGTGKTSLIKAIANHTGRHIIVVSLKMIKTRKQLEKIFFEDRYDRNNPKASVSFQNKIIVFEDIDCIGDIVLNRNKKKEQNKDVVTGKKLDESSIATLIENAATNVAGKMCTALPGPKLEDDNLTLDDILNLWDGIRETPGRIMIISSNHYNDLDPALTRPGRIDITLELSYVSRAIIEEICNHFYNAVPDKNLLRSVNDKFYTPAEVINIYMSDDNYQSIDKFMERLAQNVHV